MKKIYIKPSAKIVEMKHGASILAGSLKGKVGQNDDLQYGGDTSNDNINKDNSGYIWGD